MHTYFTAVNFNACNKAVIRKLPSVLVLPPKRNIFYILNSRLTIVEQTYTLPRTLVHPTFSFSIPYSAQLALQITNAIKMAPSRHRTQTLAVFQLPLGSIYCIVRNGFKTSAAPSTEHGAFTAPWPPVTITGSTLYPRLTRGRSAVLSSALEMSSTSAAQPFHHSRSAVSFFTLTMLSFQTTLLRAGKTRCKAEI